MPKIIEIGLYVLLGYLVNSLIGHTFAKDRNRSERFYNAAENLRIAFANERAILHPYTGKRGVMATDVLKEALPKHTAAVYQFGFFLEGETLSSFNDAWVNYYGANNDPRCPWFTKYDVGDNARQELIKNIDAILEFTKDHYLPSK